MRHDVNLPIQHVGVGTHTSWPVDLICSSSAGQSIGVSNSSGESS